MNQNQPQTPERVSFSFGMKLSMPTKYESADFHVSLSSDVNPFETSVQAFTRVKREVEVYAELAYQQIRASEEGFPGTASVPKSANESSNQKNVPEPVKAAAKPTDLKVLRRQIKAAFGTLEAQKKVTKTDFVNKYLFNKKTDELSELEVTKTIVALRENFPELGL